MYSGHQSCGLHSKFEEDWTKTAVAIVDEDISDRHTDRQTDIHMQTCIALDRQKLEETASSPQTKRLAWAIDTRAHHRDEKPERDLTYHLTCLLIYHGTTTHL